MSVFPGRDQPPQVMLLEQFLMRESGCDHLLLFLYTLYTFRGIVRSNNTRIERNMPQKIAENVIDSKHCFTLLNRVEKDGLVTLTFEKPLGLQVKPAQYLNLYPTLWSQWFHKPLSLAIATGSEDKTIQVTYKKGHRFGSKGVLNKLSIGSSLLCEGPLGQGLPFLAENKKPLLLIGAGSSLTLMRNIMYSVGDEREVSMVYSAKTAKDIPYLDDVNRWKGDPHHYYSLTQEVSSEFHTGRVNNHLKERVIDPNTNILLSGPNPFIKEMARILIDEKGYKQENIYVSINNPRKGEDAVSQLTDTVLESLSPKASLILEPLSKASSLMKPIAEGVVALAKEGTIPREQILTMTDASSIEIVDNTAEGFELLGREIRKAKKQVLIETFAWDKQTPAVQEVRKALEDLGASGKPIDVFLLVDELGPLAQLVYKKKIHRWPHDAHSMGLGNLPENIHIHIGIHHHNFLNSTHAKIAVIDGETLLLTGANFQSSNYGQNANYDAFMKMQGKIARAAFYDFEYIWKKRSNKEEDAANPILPTTLELSLKDPAPEDKAAVLFASSKPRIGSLKSLIYYIRNLLPLNPINIGIIRGVEQAKHTIRIAVPNLNVGFLKKHLAEFINKKGGNVEIILAEKFNDGRESLYGGTNTNALHDLMSAIDTDKKSHLRVVWNAQDGKPQNIHLKFWTIDDQITYFGSANLDVISLFNCHEAYAVIDNAKFTKKAISNLFTSRFESGIPITEKDISPTRHSILKTSGKVIGLIILAAIGLAALAISIIPIAVFKISDYLRSHTHRDTQQEGQAPSVVLPKVTFSSHSQMKLKLGDSNPPESEPTSPPLCSTPMLFGSKLARKEESTPTDGCDQSLLFS